MTVKIIRWSSRFRIFLKKKVEKKGQNGKKRAYDERIALFLALHYQKDYALLGNDIKFWLKHTVSTSVVIDGEYVTRHLPESQEEAHAV